MAKKHVLFKKCKSILAMGFLPIIKNDGDEYCVVTSAQTNGEWLNISSWFDKISEAVHERYGSIEACDESEFNDFEDDGGAELVDCIYSALESNFPPYTEVLVSDLGSTIYLVQSLNPNGLHTLVSKRNQEFSIQRRITDFKPVCVGTTQDKIEEAIELLTKAGVIKDGKVITL